MRPRPYLRIALASAVVAVLAMAPAADTPHVTTPRQFFGFDIGDDYKLATYTQFAEYWRKLEHESTRMKVVDIGRTSEGRPQLMAIVTSPDNFKRLDRYKEIARRLALAEGLSDDQARALAREGKAIVWIDGGLHATEVLGAHQLIETVYQLLSGTDPETLRFLQDVIVLFVHANPDGMELVSNWYMREADPARRTLSGVPRLYNKYAGHDDNRDFYMSNLAETTNMNRIMFHEWFPQIVYDHHQTGPAGTVMFAPPFRDPFNFNLDPQVPIEIDLIGAALNSRMVAEGKPGVTSRKGSTYSSWWNGGLRTIGYFHNMIGLLTETIGSPTPMRIPFIPSKQLPDSNQYDPIEPQVWHFRQSIDYSVTANRAVLDIASRNRENFLFNIYRMGRNSIERGSRDTWTITPRRVEAAEAALKRARPGTEAPSTNPGAETSREEFEKLLRDPAQRDPRGYVIPSDQPDFQTATTFINTLIKNGVSVERATAAFSVAGRSYPQGSWVVKTAQAFRPHVLDMFEPQDHPDDIPYPGGPPIPPYDNAGYTLAFQMGVQFARILDDFSGPFERVDGLQRAPAGRVTGSGPGYLLNRGPNDSFAAVNGLLGAGEDVSWITSGPQAGTFYVAAKASTRGALETVAADLGLTAEAVSGPAGATLKLRKLRIGLSDRYGGSMPSGWTRLIFERFGFPFEVVFPRTLDAGHLIDKYDVLVFPSDMISAPTAGAGRGGAPGGRGGSAARIPAELEDQIGSITAAQTIPQLRQFLEDGGTIVAVGKSTSIAGLLGLPIANHLVERGARGTIEPLPSEKYYVPGSILRVAVDRANPVAHGLPDHVDVFFDNDPVFELTPDAALEGIRPVAWFDSPAPLRSGWAFGQAYLDKGIVGLDVPVGRGRLYLFTPEITFRAQPHGTFKLLFNAIYLAARATPNAQRPTPNSQFPIPNSQFPIPNSQLPSPKNSSWKLSGSWELRVGSWELGVGNWAFLSGACAPFLSARRSSGCATTISAPRHFGRCCVPPPASSSRVRPSVARATSLSPGVWRPSRHGASSAGLCGAPEPCAPRRPPSYPSTRPPRRHPRPFRMRRPLRPPSGSARRPAVPVHLPYALRSVLWRVRAMGGRETVASACCILGACLRKRNRLPSVAYAYQPDILEALARHGLTPGRHTEPALVRQALSDLYRYEIRRLRQDLLQGRVAKPDYVGHVIALRRKYWLLSLPTDLWTRVEG